MDVLAGRKKVGIEDVTTSATVPSNCWARLMYYLRSVNSCLNDDGEDLVPSELRDYEKYYALSDGEKQAILAICSGPLIITNLMGKIFFPVDELEDGSSNEFFKITETTELIALGIRADRVVGVGGSRKEVSTIMLMTEGWAKNNFINPLKEAIQSLEGRSSPAFVPYQSGSSSSSYYSSNSSSEKSCAAVMCACAVAVPILLIVLALKFKRFTFLLIGLIILGYVSFEIAPVYLDQEDALDASSYSSWPLNTHTALITLSGEEVTYLKVFFDSSGTNQTANALAVSTTDPTHVYLTYARGRYSWWDRKFDTTPFSNVTDLLSKDSFVYFRFHLVDPNLTSSFNVTLTGVHSTSGSTDWTTIQWVQQLWFYGLFSLGALLVVVSTGIILFFCVKRR